MYGCSTISHFDQYAYSQATSIKVDALSLMDSATTPYQQHQSSVTSVMTSIDKIYEYEKNRPKNDISEKMWATLKDSTGHLYGGFIRRWQRERTLDAVFIQESKKLIGESFDQISQLESGKIKPSQVTQ
jgi:GTP-binding protein EngB required for normal cell division